MPYTKHNYQKGDELLASQLNDMDDQIALNEQTADTLVTVSNTQPLEEKNRVWVKATPSEIEIPTMEDIDELNRQISDVFQFQFNSVDVTDYDVLNGAIANDGRWYSINTSVNIPVGNNNFLKITSQESKSAIFSLIENITYASEKGYVRFANGETARRIIDPNTTVILEIPDGCNYVNVQLTTSAGSIVPAGIWLGEYPELSDSVAELDGELFRKEIVDFSLYRGIDYVIGNIKNIWDVTGTSRIIPVGKAKGIEITTQEELSTSFAFLTSEDVNVAPQYATGENERHVIPAGTTAKFDIPSDCTFISIQKTYSGGDNSPESVALYYSTIDMATEQIESVKEDIAYKKWLFYGFYVSASGYSVNSEYNIIPIQNMTIKVKCPETIHVRFRYGVRTEIDYTPFLENGDTYTFEDNMVAVYLMVYYINSEKLSSQISLDTVNDLISKGELEVYILENPGTCIERNHECTKYMDALRATPGIYSMDYADKPVLVHTSDIHGDSTRFKNICDYAQYLKADALINTGDNPVMNLSQGVTYIQDILSECDFEYANCIGNHDIYASSKADIFNGNIAPFATDYGYHKATSSDVTDELYYYKDLADKQLRIIAINEYDGVVNTAYAAKITSGQINWLISTLQSTPADYGVIILLHQVPHLLIPIQDKTAFNSSDVYEGMGALDSNYMSNGKVIGNPICKIVDAFISRGTVSDSFTNTVDNSTVNYSADFSQVPASVEFIMYLNGHLHTDYVGYVSDCTNDQLNINVASCVGVRSRLETSFTGHYDCFRNSRDATQDAFNCYVIDRENKRVGIARIGANMNVNLVPRECMWVDYV